jgi:hypothetical protein
MRRTAFLATAFGSLALGTSALTHSEWFRANAPVVRTQVRRGLLWNVWPRQWGVDPGHASGVAHRRIPSHKERFVAA